MTRNPKIIALLIDCFFLSVIFYNVYKYVPYRFEHLTELQKVHAHRVNTITKLNQASVYYSGIELDVIFDVKTNKFDVFHPPVKSIGLSLETYLSNISNKELKIWLDFKNLTENNKQQATARLFYLITKFKLNKQLLLVESQNISQLQYITNKGFLTSYYVPSDLYKATKTEKDSIYKLIKNYNKQSISFTYLNYEYLCNKFPEREKFVWALFGNPFGKTRIEQIASTRKILKDSTVKRLLVPFKSIGGNR
jgi:hypothetical protein